MNKESNPTKPLTENLLAMSRRPVFPFFKMKIERTTKDTPIIQRLKVSPDLYDFLVKIYGTNELMFYLDMLNGKIECWTPSMHLTFEAMEKFQLMSPSNKWVKDAKKFILKARSEIKI